MKVKWKENKFEIVIIVLFFTSYVVFCNYLMIELPYLSWFDQFYLIRNYYGNALTMNQLMSSYCEHGLFGYNILFLINLSLFKLTTFFDVYINDINVLITGILCVFMYKKTLGQKSKMYKVHIILICTFVFNFMQLSSGAMETQVRLGILFFVISSIMIDRVVIQNVSRIYLVGTCMVIMVSINIFGTLYSFAAIPAVVTIAIYKFVTNRKASRNVLIVLFTYLVCCVVYFFQYDLIGKGSMKSGSLLSAAIGVVTNPATSLKSLFAYNANTVFGYPTFIDKVISDNTYLAVGFVITLLLIYSIIEYINLRMYKKTAIPIMFIGYSFFVFALVILGRYFDDWKWFTNCWYTVHTKFTAIGCLWILMYSYKSKEAFKLKGNKAIIHKSIMFIGILTLMLGILTGYFAEIRRVPYERIYLMDKQQYLFVNESEEMPVSENGQTPLLATKSVTLDCIGLLKKYKLSVFKKYDTLSETQHSNQKIGSDMDNAKKISGYFNDGWVGKVSEFDIKIEKVGKLIIDGYYPKKLQGVETGTIFVNDNPYPFTITQSSFTIEIPVIPNSIANVKIVNNFSFQADSPDTRELSWILSEVKGE